MTSDERQGEKQVALKQIPSRTGILKSSHTDQVRGAMWMVLAAVVLTAAVSNAWAHDDADHQSPQLQSGQLTGVSHRSVQINHQDYALHPKVVFLDDEGRSKQLQDFKTGMFIQYQLKDDRIRQLILVTPK